MIFDSISLQTWSYILGALFLVVGLLNLCASGFSMALAKSFPRSKTCDRILSTIAFLWAAILIYSLPIDFLSRFRVYVTALVILSIPLSWWLIPDLLGCRAIGGLLVMLPAPVLQIARFCDSDWRLVVIVLMYVFVLLGMTLILYPYHLRDALSWMSAKISRVEAVGAAAVALGLLLFWLGFHIF